MENPEEPDATTAMSDDDESGGSKRPADDQPSDPFIYSRPSFSKKPRVISEATLKSRVLQITVDMYQWMSSTFFGLEDPDYRNITLGMQLTEIIYNSFVRKTRKLMGYETADTAFDDYRVKLKEKTYQIPGKRVEDKWSKIPKNYGLQFDSSALDDNNWLRDALSYLHYFDGFKARFDELKRGNYTFVTEKMGKNFELRVANYGLDYVHHNLLEGCTFPHRKKHTMIPYLGPMTLILEYIQADEVYRKKWLNVCRDEFSLIPHIDTILKQLQGKAASEICSPIGCLADLLCAINKRKSLQILIPLNCLASLDMLMTDWYAIGVSNMGNLTIDHGTRDMFFDKITFDEGAVFLYTMMSNAGRFKLEGRWKADHAKEMIFHTIFGTYKDSLDLLYWMTGRNAWFNEFRRARAATNITVPFELIPVIRYFKVIDDVKRCVYAKYDIQKRIQDASDEFFAAMRLHQQKFDLDIFEINVPLLCQYLIYLRCEVENVKIEGYQEMDSLKWYEIKGMSLQEDGPELTCSCFSLDDGYHKFGITTCSI